MTLAKNIKHKHSTGNNEWYTPHRFVDAARVVMGGIDLDPASSYEANEIVKACVFYDEKSNSLDRNWYGRVWMNPPYSKGMIKPFIYKLVSSSEVTQFCVLVNNATETVWFSELASDVDAICLVKGRIKFIKPDNNKKTGGNPLQGQIILYKGPNADEFCKQFSVFGLIFNREV